MYQNDPNGGGIWTETGIGGTIFSRAGNALVNLPEHWFQEAHFWEWTRQG
jgi:hypothetical protein